MTRRLAVMAALAALGCGGHPASTTPVPATMDQALTQFLNGVKDNNKQQMGATWGTEKGPAAESMSSKELDQRLTVIQKYLANKGFKVMLGPQPVTGHDELRTYQVQLVRDRCPHVQPIDVIRTRGGGWLVFDVHLEAATTLAQGCAPGT
ncbi:MAG TPA: hypothetical protein VJN62_00645 [Gemmatimonadales bacterium]|nr:hypothetical protein [Gemmatimonadales bacterium]